MNTTWICASARWGNDAFFIQYRSTQQKNTCLKTKGFQLNQSEDYKLYVIYRYLWRICLEQPTYRDYLQIYLKKSLRHQPKKTQSKHIFSLSFSPANRNFPLDSAARLVTAEVNRRSLKPLGSSPRITWHPHKPVDPTWDPRMIFQGFSSKIHHLGKLMLSCDIN